MYDRNGNFVSAETVADAIAESQVPYPHGAGKTCPDDESCYLCDSEE